MGAAVARAPCSGRISGVALWKAGSMAEVVADHVVSDLPDLTGISLEDLLAVSVPHALTVLDRAIEHPAQDQQDQAR